MQNKCTNYPSLKKMIVWLIYLFRSGRARTGSYFIRSSSSRARRTQPTTMPGTLNSTFQNSDEPLICILSSDMKFYTFSIMNLSPWTCNTKVYLFMNLTNCSIKLLVALPHLKELYTSETTFAQKLVLTPLNNKFSVKNSILDLLHTKYPQIFSAKILKEEFRVFLSLWCINKKI